MPDHQRWWIQLTVDVGGSAASSRVGCWRAARHCLRRCGIGHGVPGIRHLFHDHVESQCGPSGDLWPIKDVAAKAAEQAARIAGVLAIVESHPANEISKDAMASAVKLADWYLGEAIRLHGAGRVDPGASSCTTASRLDAQAGVAGHRLPRHAAPWSGGVAYEGGPPCPEAPAPAPRRRVSSTSLPTWLGISAKAMPRSCALMPLPAPLHDIPWLPTSSVLPAAGEGASTP